MIKNILVPVDFSDVTESLMRHARELARALGASVCLLHVEAPEPYFVGYKPGPQSVRDSVAREIRQDNRRLFELRDGLLREGIESKALLLQGPTAEAILKEAKRLQADLIVIGSHGRGALYHLLLGSVSNSVLAASPCPVLIVRSVDEKR